MKSAVYRSPNAPRNQPAGHINYQGIADGTGALGISAGVPLREIRDGSTNTLLIMETELSVPWTKPEDLSELPDFTDDAVFRYVMANGSVHTMNMIDTKKLKALITRDGGETIQP